MTAATLYSADEVAALLGLHVRTVRNYVREGRLPAVRIGKQYRIARADLDKLTGGRAGPAEPSTGRPRVEVSAIVRVEGIDLATMTRLSTLLTGGLANRSSDSAPLHVQTVYDREHRTMKVVAIGSADDTAKLVSLVGTLVEAEL